MNLSAIPAGAKKIRLRPLALGEKTGHHHSLVCDEMALEDAVEMYEKDGQTFVRVKTDGVRLEHQEQSRTGVAAPFSTKRLPCRDKSPAFEKSSAGVSFYRNPRSLSQR